jgi:sulfhydrogenase subunit gamma (sulfur reductase)
MMDFIDLQLVEVRAETTDLAHLKLSGVPPDFLAAYKVPGQYVQIKHGDLKPGFFAIANAPGGEYLELLIKRGAPLADIICAKKAGETLSVSTPQGKGYALDQARGKDVFVVGVGSGVAPLRALMQVLLKDRASYGNITFIYGTRCVTGFPYSGEMQAWKNRGAEVVCVCSQPGTDPWDGPVGRVHQALLAREAKPKSDTIVFACGMKPMVEDLKVALGTLGVSANQVLQNF